MNRAQAPAHVLLSLACACAPACGLNQAGVDPPADTIAYPASAVMDQSGDWLFVTNSNADLRYNDGTLIALSLDGGGGPTIGHPPAPERPTGANARRSTTTTRFTAPTRSLLLPGRAGPATSSTATSAATSAARAPTRATGRGNVRIGSFAAGMVLQQPPAARARSEHAATVHGHLRHATPATGRRSPADRRARRHVADVRRRQRRGRRHAAAPEVRRLADGSEAPGGFATCDDDHRIITATSALAAPISTIRIRPTSPCPTSRTRWRSTTTTGCCSSAT